MKKWIAIFVLLSVTISNISAQELEITEINQTTNSLNWTEFTGRVVNNTQYTFERPDIILTLKSGGKVVDLDEDRIEGPTEDMLKPGEEGVFEINSYLSPAEWDDYTFRIQANKIELDPTYISGDLIFPEESIGLVEFLGGIQILGEFINATNAVIADVEITVLFYDAEDKFLGTGETSTYDFPEEMFPNQVFTFEAHDTDVPLGDVARWEISWTYTALRLNSTPTGIALSSWGEVKSVEIGR